VTSNRKWVVQNLGFDPISTPAPAEAYAVPAAAGRKPQVEDLQRELIEFDSEGPEGRQFLAFSTATGLSRFTDIPWPKGLAPKTGRAPKAPPSGKLPRADVLVVAWTVDEGHATSRVLTPGKDSRNDYRPYTRNYKQISRSMRPGCPALNAGRLGAYWTTSVGGKRVVVFKSESHLSQDGLGEPSKKGSEYVLPNALLWQQILDDVQPSLVLTTGTAGGIGSQFEVGDVIVSPIVRFDCKKKFTDKKRYPFRKAHYSSQAASVRYLATAKKLFKANAAQLPRTNARPPKIVRVAPGALGSSVVTTDYFGFDTSDNHYGLQGLGDVSEMGDAVLGMVAAKIGAGDLRWLAVRNVSDPQIKAEGTIRDQAKIAADIYKGFGRWSSVCSAIVCWALIAAER